MEEQFRILLEEAFAYEDIRQQMLQDHQSMVYDALALSLRILQKEYITLIKLCDTKRSYGVPPEYSGILNVEKRGSWSPTDLEVARVLVSTTNSGGQVQYSQLVDRLDSVIFTLSRAHIYRSLKVILRSKTGRGVVIEGISLK